MNSMTLSIPLVAVFGLAGVFARWRVDVLLARWSEGFPVGILTVNFLGSLAAGAIYGWGVSRATLPPALTVGLLVGFCGGFTTFSTYALQSLLLVEKGQWLGAALYFGGSPLAGLFGAWCGLALARCAA